jgi:hypothetical protein
MVTGAWRKDLFLFQHFIGPVVLANSGHGIDTTKVNQAYHLWENDLRLCFEQFEKHFSSNA